MPTLYVATGDAFARIERRGGSWHATLSLQDHGVQRIAPDPHQPRTVFAATKSNGLWMSRDGGERWEDAGLPLPKVFSVAVGAADGAVYAGTEPSHLFVSHDHGASWRELEALRDLPSKPEWSFPPRPWTSHVSWIAPSPHDPRLLLVGIELGGLMRSDDAGASWQDHRPGAERDVHRLAWHSKRPGRAYEAGGGGAAWSHDGGKTWEATDAGRDHDYCWGLAVHPEDPDTWFLSAAPGPREAHDDGRSAAVRIYRWRDKGPWQALFGGLPDPLDSMPYALATAPGWLLAGFGNGDIHASRDDGDSWNRLEIEGDPLERIEALAVAG